MYLKRFANAVKSQILHADCLAVIDRSGSGEFIEIRLK